MDVSKLTGVFPPVFTPLHHDGSLNLAVIPDYAKFLKKAGVHGVYVTGTAGEGMSFSLPERKLIAQTWIQTGKTEDLATIIQVGAGCLKDTQELATFVEQEGATAIATFPNLFDKAQTVEELVDYCYEVGKHAPKTPLLYYHIPFKTSVTVPMDEFMEKGSKKIPTLSGMKYTAEDIAGEGSRCVAAADGKMKIFTGFDQLFLEGQKLGYCGGVSCAFNFLPKEGLTIFEDKGKTSESDTAQRRINNTLNLIFQTTNGFSVSAIKAAMFLLTGINVGPARKPLKNLEKSQLETLKTDLRKAGFSLVA